MFILPPPTRYPLYGSGTLLNGTRSELQATIEATNTLTTLGPEQSFTAPEGVYQAKECLFVATPMPHPSDPPPAVINPLAPTSFQPSTHSSGVRLSVMSLRYDPPPGTIEFQQQPLRTAGGGGGRFSDSTLHTTSSLNRPTGTGATFNSISSVGSLPGSQRAARSTSATSATKSFGTSWTSSFFSSNSSARRPSVALTDESSVSAQSEDTAGLEKTQTADDFQDTVSNYSSGGLTATGGNPLSASSKRLAPVTSSNGESGGMPLSSSTSSGIFMSAFGEALPLPPDNIGGVLGPLTITIPIEAPKDWKRSKKPKNSLVKNNSSFMSRTIVMENLAKKLAERSPEDLFIWANVGRSFNWFDISPSMVGNVRKEPLSKILFTKSHPLCHDVNQYTRAANNTDIVLGMSSGDAIWLDGHSNRYNRINKNGDITRSAITDIKWIPGSTNYFVATHSDGSLIIFDKDREDGGFASSGALKHQDLRSTETFRIVKSLYAAPSDAANAVNINKQNPVAMYKLSNRSLTSVIFSPDRKTLVVTSNDGFMRFLNLETEVVTDIFPSYYDGIICAAFSPDGKYLATGGQDDLVTIWSMKRKTIIARGYGHQSWVRKVAFDNWNCDGFSYRVGSVSEDGNLMLWDFSPKLLSRPKTTRPSSAWSSAGAGAGATAPSTSTANGTLNNGVGVAVPTSGNHHAEIPGEVSSNGTGNGNGNYDYPRALSTPRSKLSGTSINGQRSAIAGSANLPTNSVPNNTPGTTSTTTSPSIVLPVAPPSASHDPQQAPSSPLASLPLPQTPAANDPFTTVLHPFVPHAGTPSIPPVATKSIKPADGESESLSDIVFLENMVIVTGKDGRIWSWTRPRSKP